MNIEAKNNYINTIQEVLSFNPKTGKRTDVDFKIKYLIDNNNEEEVEKVAQEVLAKIPQFNTNNKRYKFTEQTNRETLLKLIFDECFKKNPDKVIEAAQKTETTPTSYYPLWKRAVYIQTPKNVATVTGNFLFKTAVAVAATVATYFLLYAAYEASSTIIAAKVVPFVINNTSLVVIRVSNKILDVYDWFETNRSMIFLGACCLYLGARVCGPEFISRFIHENKVWDILLGVFRAPQSVLGFVLENSLQPPKLAWSACTDISSSLRSIAQSNENDRLKICKMHSYNAWKRVIQINPQPIAV